MTRPVIVHCTDVSRKGIFHGFGVDFEEFTDGVGNYTIAIIEWEDGTLEGVPVHKVQFVTPTTVEADR
jgi:hypothetical protein